MSEAPNAPALEGRLERIVRSHSAYTLRLEHRNNRVILDYDPVLMLERNGVPDAAEHYGINLEHIRQRIDWCVRKSAGQSPSFDDFECYQP